MSRIVGLAFFGRFAAASRHGLGFRSKSGMPDWTLRNRKISSLSHTFGSISNSILFEADETPCPSVRHPCCLHTGLWNGGSGLHLPLGCKQTMGTLLLHNFFLSLTTCYSKFGRNLPSNMEDITKPNSGIAKRKEFGLLSLRSPLS